MLNKIKRFFYKELYNKIETLEQQKALLSEEYQNFKIKAQNNLNETNKYYKGKLRNFSRS